MSELKIQVIKDSFDVVLGISEEVMIYFYQRLFEKYPDAQDLFENTNMEIQRDNLFSALLFIVDNIEKPKVVLPYLEKMGSRHVNYGVQESHYALVGDVLLETFAHFFKENWTPELKEQWLKAYALIAAYMIKGMRTSDKHRVA